MIIWCQLQLLSFFILLICALSLFFLRNLAKDWSILFILENYLLVLLIFATACINSILYFLLWSLWFHSFYLRVLFVLHSLVALGVSLDCLFKTCCFLRCDWITINFPLRTAFAASYRFWVIVFLLSFEYLYFFKIYSLISLVISRLFSSMLFRRHAFF